MTKKIINVDALCFSSFYFFAIKVNHQTGNLIIYDFNSLKK